MNLFWPVIIFGAVLMTQGFMIVSLLAKILSKMP